MSTSTHSKSWRRSYNLIAGRFYSVIILLAMAFVMNDITVISSFELSSMGMESEARLVQFIPIPVLILWITCVQIWIANCRTGLGWLLRLICLYLATLALAGSMWLYAFRNAERILVQSMPEHSQIDEVENATGLKLSWAGDGQEYYVMFDKRNPENRRLLTKALTKSRIQLKR